MAGVKVVFSGESAELARELARMQAQFSKLEDKLARVEGKAGKAKKTQKDAFGGGALRELKSFAGGVVGIGAAIGVVTQAFREAHQARKQFAEGLRGREEGLKRLAQVSTSGQEFAYLENRAKQIGVREGMGVGDAANLVFQAKSQGLLGDLDVLSKTQRFTDAQAMIEAVGKFKSAYGGREAGSTKQLLNKFISAAAASDVSVEQIARAAVISAQGAVRIGATDEEQLALLSVLSPAFKSPETASQRMQALATVLAKGVEISTGRKVRDPVTGKLVAERQQISYGGEGFLAGLERFQREQPAEFAKAMLGREEAAAAFSALQTNMPAVIARRAEIEAAQASGKPLETALGLADTGLLGQLRREGSQKVALNVVGEPSGRKEMSFEDVLQQLRVLNEQQGTPGFGRMSEMLLRGEHWLDFLTGSDLRNPESSAMARAEGRLDAARSEGLLTEGGTAADALLEELRKIREGQERASGGALRGVNADDREYER